MNKVYIAGCSGYGDEVERSVRSLAERMGGLSSIIRPGNRVLLKPNLLSGKAPERSITTHPDLVRAMIRLTRDCGADPFVADSPASVLKIEKVWTETGIRALCAEENVELLSLEKSGSVEFCENDMSFTVARPVLEADVVINMPKLKTHLLTILTNAVKNMYGAVPGTQKMMLHKLYPTPNDFGRLLAAIYSKVPPALTVCDAVMGMHGSGPSAGDPVALGFIGLAENGIALDYAMCDVLGIPVRSVHYLEHLRCFNPEGEGDIDNSVYEFVGEPPRVTGFKVPATIHGRLIPRRLVHVFAPALWCRPVFLENCVSCGLCVKSCPVGAIRIENGQHPVLNPDECIECCCCHEVCPESAVEMRRSPLLRTVEFLKGIIT